MFQRILAVPLILGLLLALPVLSGCSKKSNSVSSTSDFDKILQDNPVVLVDFQADWCPPCRAMKPVVHELEQQYKGKVKVVEIDVDANPELAQRYRASSIPLFLVFKNGVRVDSILGAVPRGELEAALKRALGS